MISTAYLHQIRNITLKKCKDGLEIAQAYLNINCDSWDDQDQQHYAYLLAETQNLMERVNTLDKLIRESESNDKLIEPWI